MKISREVKTAILVITALLLVIFGYNYLKGQNLLDKSRNFYAVYDNVEGLAPGADVTINGLNVGKVLNIEFADNTGKLRVHFKVDSDFVFSNKSIAKVYGIGFISGKSLAIEPVYIPGENAKDGDVLPGAIEDGIMELVTEKLEPLQAKIEGAVTDADAVLKSVNSVLDEDTQKNLRKAISDFSITATELKKMSNSVNGLLSDNKSKLDHSIASFDKTATNFATFSDSLSQVNLGDLVRNLEKMVVDFEGIANNLKTGKGTAGKLLQDDQVYVNLERTTKQMELLLEDMRLQPKRYVHFSLFGKRAKEYKAPSDSLR